MKLSIVTPSFRQLDYLRRCVASVADQEGDFELEHLVQEGGGGPEFEEWAKSQQAASVVCEEDAGMYDAINRGFRRASGDVVAWLNCDEQYLPGALDAVACWFADHPDRDLLFGDVVLVSPEGEPLSYRQALCPLRGHIRNCFLATYSAATFVRRRVIDEGHLLDTGYKAIADAVWLHGLLGRGYRAGVLNRPLAAFTQTGENLGQSAAGHADSERWRRRPGRAVMRPLWSTVHRFRKLASGTYRSREVSVDLHLDGTGKRVRRSARVGEVWKTA